MLNRGRSRIVSDTALARQASNERRMIVAPVPLKPVFAPSFVRSTSSSPPSSTSMSPDYDTPPSPPRSLQDQVHVAYAHDDIHLAKILLLRLKGIEIVDNDDPRIAQVQDEDFDFCFVPKAPLMDHNAMDDMQAKELHRLHKKKRQERLRICENKWEEEKRRLRDHKTAMEKKRLDDNERRRKPLSMSFALDDDSHSASTPRHRLKPSSDRRLSRKIVSYTHLPSALLPSHSHPRFFYDFPSSFASSSSSTRKPPPSVRIAPKPPLHDSSVSFADVLKSMDGPLFPLSHLEPKRRSPSTSSSPSHTQAKRRRDARLLDSLLAQIESNDDERRKCKGKQRAHHQPSILPCLACSSSAPSPPLSSASTSSSSPSLSPASSWLSFRPTSANSSSSDLTTPSSSPLTSSKYSWFASSNHRSWFPDLPIVASPPPALRHSCHPHNRPVLSPCSESPLVIQDEPSSASNTRASSAVTPTTTPSPKSSRRSSFSSSHGERTLNPVRAAKEGAGVLVRRMSKLVEIAMGFQTAYVTTAWRGVASSPTYDDCSSDDDGEAETQDRPKRDFDDDNTEQNRKPKSRSSSAGHRTSTCSPSPRGSLKTKLRLRPAGYRVSPQDVAIFIDPMAQTHVVNASSTDGNVGSRSNRNINGQPSIGLGGVGLGRGTTITTTPPPPKYIPLTSPYPPTEVPRTVLPNPPPFKLVFKPIPSPCRSPFRFHGLSEVHTTYPRSPLPSNAGSAVSSGILEQMSNLVGDIESELERQHQRITWRIRSVGNPVHLRLKALHNVVCRSGIKWEGAARETALGGGRERVVGVAYEGVGRSLLGRAGVVGVA